MRKHYATRLHINRWLIVLVRLALILVSFPIFTVMGDVGLSKVTRLPYSAEGSSEGGFMIASAVGGFAAAIYIAWIFPKVFDVFVAFLSANVGEPITSTVAFGILGALLVGGFVLGAVLLLGHAGPLGPGLSPILPLTAFGILLFLIFGFVRGTERRNDYR